MGVGKTTARSSPSRCHKKAGSRHCSLPPAHELVVAFEGLLRQWLQVRHYRFDVLAGVDQEVEATGTALMQQGDAVLLLLALGVGAGLAHLRFDILDLA